jgi:NAD(P)-dependent dehydrogenase (short-subunit alcohol dehydrogenase family)
VTALRKGLLEGQSVVLVDDVPASVDELLSSLGANLAALSEPDEERMLERARAAAPVNSIVCSSGAELEGIERAWIAIRAIASGALIPAGAGRIVLLAPGAAASPHACAVRAALENLARTLSVEWARYGITTTTIWPRSGTQEGELAELVAYLCSPAGAYFSGCRFDLGGLARMR